MAEQRDPRLAELGALIAAAREAKGWSQAELASMVTVSMDTVQNWEQGRCEPLLLAAVDLFRVLGLAMGAFAAISEPGTAKEIPRKRRGRPSGKE